MEESCMGEKSNNKKAQMAAAYNPFFPGRIQLQAYPGAVTTNKKGPVQFRGPFRLLQIRLP